MTITRTQTAIENVPRNEVKRKAFRVRNQDRGWRTKLQTTIPTNQFDWNTLSSGTPHHLISEEIKSVSNMT